MRPPESDDEGAGRIAQRIPDWLRGPVVVVPERIESHGSASWGVTFADLVALLLAFFVMLFAMSKVDLRKWQNLTDALARGLDTVSQETRVVPRHSLDIEADPLTEGQDLDYLAGVLSQQLASRVSLSEAVVRRYRDRLVISLPPRALGATGEDRPPNSAGGALFEVAGVLRRLRNRVEVVGYATAAADAPAAGAEASPWRRALAQALAAGERLRAAGYDREMTMRAQILSPAAQARRAPGALDLVVRRDAAGRR